MHGLDPEAGLTSPNLDEVDTNRALIASAKRVVVLADHTKWRLAGLSTIVGLSEVDVLISDTGLPETARDVLSSDIADVRIVDPVTGHEVGGPDEARRPDDGSKP